MTEGRWTREEFIIFLEKTLIPDLIDSGKIHTAEDFCRATIFMKYPNINFVNDWTVEQMIELLRR